MQLLLSELFTSDRSVIVILILCAVLVVGLLIASKTGGKFLGHFKIGGVSAEVKSAPSASISVEDVSAGHNINIKDQTTGRIAAHKIRAGKSVSITTEEPTARRSK